MKATYKLFKNYMLPISGIVLLLSIVGAVIGTRLLAGVAPSLDQQLAGSLGPWTLWLAILGGFGILVAGWYFAEQVYLRRKFEQLIGTDKRTDFQSSRKRLDDMAKRLPDGYRARVKEKEAQFVASKRA